MTLTDTIDRWRKFALLALPAVLAACAPAPVATTAPDTAQGGGNDAWELAARCAAAPQGIAGWTSAAPPARIHGETYYVGTCGISALLVTSDQGHILIDGGVAEAAPLVAANIVKLGFKLDEVRWIVSSHEHWDHVAALAELRRLTGARVAALPIAAKVLSSGEAQPDDPQRARLDNFTPVRVDRVLSDGEVIEVGGIRMTAHATPAHAPGSASWTWRSCMGSDCRTIAYADSATLISNDDYRFTDHPARVAEAREGLARIGNLPCDVLVTPHPEASNLFPRLEGKAPLIDPQACRNYADAANLRLTSRLADEQAGEGAQ